MPASILLVEKAFLRHTSPIGTVFGDSSRQSVSSDWSQEEATSEELLGVGVQFTAASNHTSMQGEKKMVQSHSMTRRCWWCCCCCCYGSSAVAHDRNSCLLNPGPSLLQGSFQEKNQRRFGRGRARLELLAPTRAVHG